jgi:hypothetical protein
MIIFIKVFDSLVWNAISSIEQVCRHIRSLEKYPNTLSSKLKELAFTLNMLSSLHLLNHLCLDPFVELVELRVPHPPVRVARWILRHKYTQEGLSATYNAGWGEHTWRTLNKGLSDHLLTPWDKRTRKPEN